MNQASSLENSRPHNYEYDQYYLSRIRPWCLGNNYDFCPLMIMVMIFVIIVSAILIVILCIHNRKPYITQILVSYLTSRKNKLMRIIFCKGAENSSNYSINAHRHSAIHNSIWWINNDISRTAPPSYEESLANNNRDTQHLTSILGPIATTVSSTSSSGYGSNINNGFTNEDNAYAVPQVRQYRENAIDAIDLPENNYYENRRFNRNNLSFLSTDSFQFIQSSYPIRQQNNQTSLVSLQMVPQSFNSTSTLRSIEMPPDYDSVTKGFKKLNDCDNLNKFKRLQQKYQQSRRMYYQQQQKFNRQSSATILSESEIVV